jgi:putative nucleotidyltransferase with HDIG domain
MAEDSAAGGPARGLLSPARRIGWRIVAPYAALTIVLAVAGTYLVTRLVGGSLDERFNNQLAEASSVAADAVVRRERQHLETLRAVSFTEGAPAAVAAGDPQRLAALIEPLMANAALERVEVISPEGQRLYGAQIADWSTFSYVPIVDNDRPGQWELVQSALAGADAQGDKYTQLVDTSSYGYVLYTAGPIYSGEQLVGVVLVGTPLPSFLSAAQAEALADVTIYDTAGRPLGTSFPVDAATPIDLTAEDGVLAAVDQELVREHRTLYGRDYDLLYAPLQIRGETVGYTSVALPSSFIFNAQAATRTQMVVLFAIAIAVALVMGWLISRTITKPVSKLVAAANAVAHGDLSVRSGIAGHDEIGVLGRAFDAMTERLQKQLLSTVRALTSAIDARDPYTHGHSLRVGQLAVMLGTEMGLTGTALQHLEIGGYLHDIGKIGVRDDVLLKPGSLTPEERAAIERHPTIGLNILEHVELSPEVVEFVGGHHEKLNGSGYPEGRHEHELSVYARIATVADIYDALVTDRPYRAGMSPAQALGILRREMAEGQLDERVVNAMEAVLPRWEQRRREEPLLRGFAVAPTEAADDRRTEAA